VFFAQFAKVSVRMCVYIYIYTYICIYIYIHYAAAWGLVRCTALLWVLCQFTGVLDWFEVWGGYD